MPSPAPIIVWFRRDLRLTDNPALAAAASSGRGIIPVFILDEGHDVRPLGAAARWWLGRSLSALAESMRAAGARLILRRGDPARVLADLIVQTGAEGLYWNRLYDERTRTRDAKIKAEWSARGLECRSFNAALLNEPWEVTSTTGSAYQVFTAYWRAARITAGGQAPHARPVRLSGEASQTPSDRLADWELQPRTPDWSRGFECWKPGEDGAAVRLETFIDTLLGGYAERRNFPSPTETSRLSPHLAFGEIGPRQIWAAVETAAHTGGVNAEPFLRELGWREFNHHLLFHHPEITQHSFRPGFDAFPWRDDSRGLTAWRRGRTGYPIVDAGMRELWTTGWMHNRVRMIVASFLIKDLMIDWRCGEAWFWDTLVDADIANNVANWQWVAGSGADAAPFFRIFNPVLQGEKFDPLGEYVRKWLPELAKFPDRWVHAPWRASVDESGTMTLGDDYPKPIVDHRRVRERALEAFRGLPA